MPGEENYFCCEVKGRVNCHKRIAGWERAASRHGSYKAYHEAGELV